MKIPKIIHQIYEDPAGPSKLCVKLAESWKEKNLDWEYRFWGKAEIDAFFNDNFTYLYESVYKKFPFDVQRWDLIRLLVLYRYGGLYVDMDYECLNSIDTILKDSSCCIGLEPQKNTEHYEMPLLLGNAFIAATPKHDFIIHAIAYIQLNGLTNLSKHNPTQVMKSTGPFMFTKLYNEYKNKKKIKLLPDYHVAPLVKNEIKEYLMGENKYDRLIKNAYAMHYFMGSWIEEIDNKNELDKKNAVEPEN